MTAAVSGFDDLGVTGLTCDEYETLWETLNGYPRHDPRPGRLTVFAGHIDPGVERVTVWGFRAAAPMPALSESVRDGAECRHWLFAPPRHTETT